MQEPHPNYRHDEESEGHPPAQPGAVGAFDALRYSDQSLSGQEGDFEVELPDVYEGHDPQQAAGHQGYPPGTAPQSPYPSAPAPGGHPTSPASPQGGAPDRLLEATAPVPLPFANGGGPLSNLPSSLPQGPPAHHPNPSGPLPSGPLPERVPVNPAAHPSPSRSTLPPPQAPVGPPGMDRVPRPTHPGSYDAGAQSSSARPEARVPGSLPPGASQAAGGTRIPIPSGQHSRARLLNPDPHGASASSTAAAASAPPQTRMPVPASPHAPHPQSQHAPVPQHQPASRPQPAQPSKPEPAPGTVSAGGAFLMAVLANLSLVLLVVLGLWAFPKEARSLVGGILDRFDPGGGVREVPVVPGVDAAVDRMEIMELEDRAIFRGERTALDQLQRLSRELDPADPSFDAVQASLIRIRQRYQLSQGEVPPPLDSREIVSNAETEKDLPVLTVVDVLRDRRQTPTKRQRAAYLLSNSRQSAAAQNALFHAIQDDPNLNVVRQSFQSFQEVTGYPGRDAFDADAIDRWWARNASSFIGQANP